MFVSNGKKLTIKKGDEMATYDECFEPKKEYDGYFGTRMEKKELKKFKEKVKLLNKTSAVMLREMIKAFNDDRIRITPTNEQRESMKIYD